jgi:hypothetical protein
MKIRREREVKLLNKKGLKMKKNNLISISIKNGIRQITIDGKIVEPYLWSGIQIPASEVVSIPINNLSYFHPIVISFDEKFRKENNISNLRNIVASITISLMDEAEVFVTYFFPNDITKTYERNVYKTALKEIINENEFCFLHSPETDGFQEDGGLTLEDAKKTMTDWEIPEDNFDLRFVRFTIKIGAETFEQLFCKLSTMAKMIESKTRERMESLI